MINQRGRGLSFIVIAAAASLGFNASAAGHPDPSALPWGWIVAGGLAILLFGAYFIRQMMLSGGVHPAPAMPLARQPIELTTIDYESFELLVHDLNEIWRAQDRDALYQIATAGMAGRLASRFDAQQSHDKNWMVHELSLVRGDLVQAWHEADRDVAQMNLGISTLESDGTEAALRRFVSREIWSFERALGGRWLIAGVRGVE